MVSTGHVRVPALLVAVSPHPGPEQEQHVNDDLARVTPVSPGVPA
jgi:hypothetical protein